MESPTSENNNNNNNTHQMTNHTDDQTPQPIPPLPSSEHGNSNNNNNSPNTPPCFTNSCYVASEPTADPPTTAVVVQPQSIPGGLAMATASSQIESLNLNAIDLENGNVVTMTPKEKELVQEILVRERRIRELEDALRIRNEEVAELRSHLDKFQSVFPFNNQRSTPAKGSHGIPKFSGIVLPSEAISGDVAGASASGAASSQDSSVVNSAEGGAVSVAAATPTVMHHRQRAQGISAEPQSSRSMFELLNVTFPKFDKEER